MKVKKYIVILTLVLMIAFSYAGSAVAGAGGCKGGTPPPPPPDTNSIPIESPAT